MIGSVPPNGESFTWKKYEASTVVSAYPSMLGSTGLWRLTRLTGTWPTPSSIGPVGRNTELVSSISSISVLAQISRRFDDSTCVLDGRNATPEAMGALVTGEVARLTRVMRL